jgi:hypothetical protein
MKKTPNKPLPMRGLTIDEIRLVSDLRVMHAKVDDLFQVIENLKVRHGAEDIRRYSDRKVLDENIQKVDEIYLWFLKLKEGKIE